MSLKLEFSLTFRDYYDGQLLHARRAWWPRLNSFMYRFGFPVWGLLLVTLGIVLATLGTARSILAIVLGAGLFLMSYPVYMRLRLKHCFRQTRTGDGFMAFEFDETGIRSTTQGTRGEIEWSAIRTVREDGKLLLLYLAPAKMFMIPKRVCSPSQLEELRQLCQSRITPL